MPVKETFKPMVCRFPAYSLFMDIQTDCCVRVGFMFPFSFLSMVHAWFVTSLVASFYNEVLIVIAQFLERAKILMKLDTPDDLFSK